MNAPKVPEKLRVKDWFIREGDRVCVIKGRHGVKGCIGKVTEVDMEAETVKVENVNLVSRILHHGVATRPDHSHPDRYPLPRSTSY